ncbi:MAG: hypothetical protein ACFCUP_06435 [Actinomycetales bacterium]
MRSSGSGALVQGLIRDPRLYVTSLLMASVLLASCGGDSSQADVDDSATPDTVVVDSSETDVDADARERGAEPDAEATGDRPVRRDGEPPQGGGERPPGQGEAPPDGEGEGDDTSSSGPEDVG